MPELMDVALVLLYWRFVKKSDAHNAHRSGYCSNLLY